MSMQRTQCVVLNLGVRTGANMSLNSQRVSCWENINQMLGIRAQTGHSDVHVCDEVLKCTRHTEKKLQKETTKWIGEEPVAFEALYTSGRWFFFVSLKSIVSWFPYRAGLDVGHRCQIGGTVSVKINLQDLQQIVHWIYIPTLTGPF